MFSILSCLRPKGAVEKFSWAHVRSEKAAIDNPKILIFTRPVNG